MQVEVRHKRRKEGRCRWEVDERQAKRRQAGGDAEERRKAVQFLLLDVVMFFCCVCSARMQCLSCVACFWDGLGSADKVSLNTIKCFKTRKKCLFYSLI